MEAIGVISRLIPSSSGAAEIDGYCHPHKTSGSTSSCSFTGIGLGLRRVCRKTRRFVGVSGHEFRQSGHLEYYSSGGGNITCGGGGGGKKEKDMNKKEKEDRATTKMMKKRLKILEGLSRDLSMFSSGGMDFGFADNALFDQVKAKTIAEAAEVLQGQIKQLIAKDTELKMRRKAEKMMLRLQSMPENEQSSSSTSSTSSDSSDNECGQGVDMREENVLRPVIEHESIALPGLLVEEKVVTNSEAPILEALSVIQSSATQERTSTMGASVEIGSSGSRDQGYRFGSGSVFRDYVDNVSSIDKCLAAGVSSKKIEVCMGGKCKKSGAAVLLGELQRLVGVEGAVSGCKCMGKCRDGPNVRILKGPSESVTNPLCIGVGLEDVDLIMSNFFGESSELSLPATS